MTAVESVLFHSPSFFSTAYQNILQNTLIRFFFLLCVSECEYLCVLNPSPVNDWLLFWPNVVRNNNNNDNNNIKHNERTPTIHGSCYALRRYGDVWRSGTAHVWPLLTLRECSQSALCCLWAAADMIPQQKE